MPTIVLSEARIKVLRPRPSAYDVRDAKLKCFGIRTLSSGAKQFFIHIQRGGTCVWKMVSDASAASVDEAWELVVSLLAAIRFDADASKSTDATRFEAAADTVFERFSRVWKDQTPYVNGNHLRRHILARFSPKYISRTHPRACAAPVRLTPGHHG